MKKILDSELTVDTIKLKQLGGTVSVIRSKMCYVKFDVSGIKVSYVYNINKDGNYFLERIMPYPLPIKEYDSEDSVFDVIQFDLEQFRNAVKSHNIDEFIEVSKQFNRSLKNFENLFLYYNVPFDRLNLIHSKLNELNSLIEETKEHSKLIEL